MKNITPGDATLLALVAEHASMPEANFKNILAQFKDSYMKLVAQATRELLTGRPYSRKYTKGQIALARHCRQWVRENRQRLSTKLGVLRRH